MSQLNEFREVLKNIKLAWERHQKAALVMLISVKGSAYRLPGTKMMMSSDGKMYGTISGGCLESDIYGWAEKSMETQSPHLQIYDLSENEIWSLGIGCKGNLEVLILPISEQDGFWLKVNEEIQKDNTVCLVLEVTTGRRLLIKENSEILGDYDYFPSKVIKKGLTCLKNRTRAETFNLEGKRYVIDSIQPAERLIIVGAGRDARPVAELASKAGFSVSILDSREDLNNERYFPSEIHIVSKPEDIYPNNVSDSWWIVMNHHLEKDEAALLLALNSNPRYIGVLGPRSRTDEMLTNIGYQLTGGPIHSPIGLDLGAETMEEVAISIVSELMSLRSGRIPVPLHGRTKIHV